VVRRNNGGHLHFQLSDGPEITTSNSLPFSLDSYRPGDAAHAKGVPPPLRGIAPAASNPAATPLTYTVINFGY